MTNDKNDWRNVDLSELTEQQRTLYAASKAAYQAYARAKGAFEQQMQADNASNLPAGMELKFGYMFGKLSVAIGPKREAKAIKAQSSGTLADWLAGKAAGGHRA